MRKYTPLENCLNIYEPRYWFYIPGFNGYELSNDGFVRSMKHYRRYPYGILIKPVSTKVEQNTTDPLFVLSDNNNERQRIRLSQLAYLAKNNPYAVSGYPRATIISDPSSRNDSIFVRKKIKTPPLDNSRHYAKFTIIQDGTETLGMEAREPGLIVPIISTNGDGEYYGRKDCRAFSARDVQTGPGKILSRGQ